VHGVNDAWVLASRPEGMVSPANFARAQDTVPELAAGQLLVRNLYLSLDPAMRGWISGARSYMPPVAIGEVMRGGCAGEVIASRHPDFEPGELIQGMFGWQRYAVSDGSGVTRIPAGIAPTQALGVLGFTGLTAYFGLAEIGKPKAGETVVISGAAGATGSVAGQLARLRGARVIGIAGGQAKCSWLVDELGFEAAIDYREEDLRARLKELCPDGIDVYWDNVGGEILEAALARLALRARVIFCGAISAYNDSEPPRGPRNFMQLLVSRARLEGFLVFDYLDRVDEAMAELVPLVRSGELRYREDIRAGLENAPAALCDLFTGANGGKLMVRIAEQSEGVI
jgi:NADPH-dependent curcumin reductase CurA